VAERLRDGRGWRVGGRKIDSTGIPLLRWLVVWAGTDDPEPPLGSFLVEAATPDDRVEGTSDALVMRATRSDDVVFEGAEIPGLGAPLATLPRFQAEVGPLDALLTSGDALLLGAVTAVDAGEPGAAARAALAEYAVTNQVVEVVLAATALVGNPVPLRRNPLERHLCNVLHGRIHAPQDDAILGTAGQAALPAVAPGEVG
jgi:alkylation response protein AidB-like acyl-CoA dehydrogenase